MENPIKMNDLGVPLFLETSKSPRETVPPDTRIEPATRPQLLLRHSFHASAVFSAMAAYLTVFCTWISYQPTQSKDVYFGAFPSQELPNSKKQMEPDFITPKFDFTLWKKNGKSRARGFISFPEWVSPCIFGGGWRFKCLCGRNYVGPIFANDLLLDFGCVVFLLSFWEGTLRWLEVS